MKSQLSLLLLASLALSASGVAAAPVSARNLPALMPSPEFALEHAEEIGLTSSQRDELQTAVRDLQQSAQKFSEQVKHESDALAQLLAAETLDATAVAAQFDKVLAAEDEVKRLRMRMSLQTRASLTPAQREALSALENKARPRSPSPEQQELARRMERMRGLIERAKGEGRDLSSMRATWKRVDQLTREGKTADAIRLLEETAQSLEQSLSAPASK